VEDFAGKLRECLLYHPDTKGSAEKLQSSFVLVRTIEDSVKKSHPEPFLPVSRHTEFRKEKRNFLCILPIDDGFV
jgi:hypothetical protein